MTDWTPAWTREEGARRVRELFDAQLGGEPDGVWSAPGRANLIGEHTDYSGGLSLPFALPHRTYVALRRRDDDVVRLVSAQEPGAVWEARLADLRSVIDGPVDGAPTGWGTYVAGVAWALAQDGHEVTGFEAVVDSCVPYGAGLSSSAALESATAVALDDVLGLGLGGTDDGRKALAAACVRAENEIAGAATGGMDQAASLRCQEDHAILLDSADHSVRQVPMDLGDHALLVIDTRAPHSLVDGQYAARRAMCEEAAVALGIDYLGLLGPDDLEGALTRVAHAVTLGDPVRREVVARRVRHVVTENARVRETTSLLSGGRVPEVGAVLSAAHASLRDDFEVSCRELDVAVDAAVTAGSLGGRMVGGGFGGSVIALVRTSDAERVADDVARAFADADLTAPGFLLATASAPAGRDA